jgi:catechol 2,3-dioxygenase-like lactoylglutathione lyase family enzyme
MRQLNTRDTEGARAFYGAVLGWETDTFEMGEGEITLWRVPGYVGGEPEQLGLREVIGVMAYADRFQRTQTLGYPLNKGNQPHPKSSTVAGGGLFSASRPRPQHDLDNT